MVTRKDRNYKDHQPLIVLEIPLTEGEVNREGVKTPNIPAQAVGFIDRVAVDENDRRELFEALGYTPYSGGNNALGRTTKVIREPQWAIARKVLANYGS